MSGLYTLTSQSRKRDIATHNSNMAAQNRVNWGSVGHDYYKNNFPSGDIVQNCTSIYQFIKWGQAENDNDSTTSPDSQKDNETLNEKYQQMSDLYSEAGVNSKVELETKISTQDNTVSTKDSALKGIQTNITNKEQEIAGLDKTAPDYQAQLTKLEGELESLKQQESEAQSELEEAKIETVRLKTILGKVENLELEIKEQNGEETGVTYDVKKETDDIKDFMNALKDFNTNKTKESAQNLKNIYEKGQNNDNGIDTRSIKNAWSIIEKEVQAYIDGKQPVQPTAK